MSDKIDKLIAEATRIEYAAQDPFPWSGCLTLILGIIVAAILIASMGG